MEIEINTVHLSATLSTESLKVIEILISYIVLDWFTDCEMRKNAENLADSQQ